MKNELDYQDNRDAVARLCAGCNAAACHAQMYTMGTVLRHGSKRNFGDDD